VALTNTPIDRLIAALLGETVASGADRVVVGSEPSAVEQGVVYYGVRWWEGEQMRHRLLLDYPVMGQVTRRILLLAGLDPWHVRSSQHGTMQAMGRWSVEVSGERGDRHATLRPLETTKVDDRDWLEQARTAASAVVPDMPSHESQADNVRDLERAALESPVVRLVNLILINGWRQRARDIELQRHPDRLTVELVFEDGTRRQEMTPPLGLWSDIRRRLLVMSGVPPWVREPDRGYFMLRLGKGLEPGFVLDLLADGPDARIRLRILTPDPTMEDTAAVEPATDLCAASLLADVLAHPRDDA